MVKCKPTWLNEIINQTISVETLAQNGIAERKNLHLFEVAQL